MRYLIALAVAAAICVAGCGSKETGKAKTAANTKPNKARQESSEVAWVKLDSGLEYRDLKLGTGAEAKDGDYVTAHYKGWLDDGTVFDSSMTPGREPLAFKLGTGLVIPGWDQGLKGVKAGGKRELKIPPNLAYGDEEQPGIPAGSTLHFSVELIKIGE